jgi:hypothetical protein
LEHTHRHVVEVSLGVKTDAFVIGGSYRSAGGHLPQALKQIAVPGDALPDDTDDILFDLGVSTRRSDCPIVRSMFQKQATIALVLVASSRPLKKSS